MGHDARCTFVENFDLTIYFSKIMTNKYKKIPAMKISWGRMAAVTLTGPNQAVTHELGPNQGGTLLEHDFLFLCIYSSQILQNHTITDL
jgi:hypothetical protein